MRAPYISITDFMDITQVDRMRQVFFECQNAKTRDQLLGVGVMMSYETLNNLPSKWTNVFPEKERIKDIFQSRALVLNTLHYADYEGIDIEKNLENAIGYGGPHLDALQLDMIWPDPKIIIRLKQNHPRLLLILQINNPALDQVKNSPDKLVDTLLSYAPFPTHVPAIDYVLFDKSMGRGLGLDGLVLAPFARAVRQAYSEMGLAFAGGLGPDTIGLLAPLIKEFPDMSIDAQSQLRSSGNALDPIDWPRAEAYLRRAIAIFEKYKS